MSNISPKNIQISDILNYIVEGSKLAFSPQIRPYIIIPIIANMILICLTIVAFYFGLSYYFDTALSQYSSGMAGLLLSIAAIVLTIFLSGLLLYFFSAIAIIIASPFYGLLASRIETIQSGHTPPDEPWSAVIKDVPRILKRELHKQCYFIPRALLCLLLSLIPIINFVAPILWLLLSSYMGAIQFTDYGFDNHKISFKVMRKTLNENRICTLSLGFLFVVGLAIPLLNLIVPVIAVCAATLYFIDMQKYIAAEQIENK